MVNDMDTETDFDGSRRPYMRLWINDIKGSTADWTCAQFGAHMRLLMAAWQRGHVPSNEKALRRICRDMDWDEMAEVLERWRIVTIDGVGEVYINNRLERERERMMKDSRAKAENGRKGGVAKAKQTPSKEGGKNLANGVANDLALPYSHTPILPDSQSPESQIPQSQVVGNAPRKARRPADPLRWDFDEGFVGITDEERERWADAYPLIDVPGEILRAAEHVRSNVDKQRMKRWRKFLTDWLARGNGWAERDAKRAVTAPAKGAAHGFRANRTHIPPDCRPEDEYLFWDGAFPRIPNLYTDNDGNLRHGETRNIICPAKPKLQLTAPPNRSNLTNVGESHV
jgi:uncharacterized protein YdaU (DUF1376 family)